MKNIFLLILIFAGLTLDAQNGTIKVKKPGNCDFKIYASKSMYGLSYTITEITESGVTEKDTCFMGAIEKTDIHLGSKITVSKDSLHVYFRNICETSKYKLVSVTISPQFEQPEAFLKLVIKDK